MTKINFTKMHGAGNDFVLIDDRGESFPERGNLIAAMAADRTGIGCEGVVLVRSSSRADFRMTFYNPDGTEADLCGNGALFARADHAVQDLALVKALAAAVLFDDDHRQALHRFIGGEALGAREALAPAADAAALFGRAGINDLALFVSAIGAFHRAEPLFSS